MRLAILLFTASLVIIAADGDPAKGKELFRACSGCHNTDSDARKMGPSLRTLYGKVMLRNGKRANDQNVRALILDGYNGMPPYRNTFREEEMDDLVAYLRTLKGKPSATPAPSADNPTSLGRDLFVAHCGRCHGEGPPSETKPGGSLKGLFGREKLSNGEAVSDTNAIALLEEGHGGMTSTSRWLDAAALKAVLVYLRSL